MLKSKLLTPIEIAEEMRVTHRTVLNMLRDGELRGFKFKGQWRIEERDLKAYIASQGTASYSERARQEWQLTETENVASIGG